MRHSSQKAFIHNLRKAIIILSFLALQSCGGNPKDFIEEFIRTPDAEPIRASIRTAIPLAHIAATSMEAVHGNASSSVSVSTTCSSYPCAAVVSMELSQDDLPFDFAASGNVTIFGLWTSRETAVLTVTFNEVYAGVSSYSVRRVSTFPVTRTPESNYFIVYTDIDVNVDTTPDELSEEEVQAELERLDIEVSNDAEVNVSLGSWAVEIDNGGTIDEYSDDVYMVSGGGQYIGVANNSTSSSTQIIQLGLAQALVSHDCSTNPTEGYAFINEVGVARGDQASAPVIATALLELESSCNGSIRVYLATGNYVTSNGDDIEMDLNLP